MGGNVDNRIIQMQFDNAEFERNISKSEKSLERFKEELDFSECEESLESFNDATKKLTFESMAENLQKLTDKFTGFGNVAEFVISQIRQGLRSAAYSAEAFVKSLSIDQINVGMDKFSQLTKNVQTIIAATGKTEEEVYAVMERLNDYTDQTSYNFTDMAANIGKFTSVGIDLSAAEKQMEGIANWAARSGGGINEASRAMYNLSQAMGVGALLQKDWMSIEGASMATKEFKQQLIEAGVEAGNLEVKTRKNKQTGDLETYYVTAKKLGKQEEVNYQNLSSTLNKRWADTAVMQKAFMSYYYENLTYDEKLDTRIKLAEEQKHALEKVFEGDYKMSNAEWSGLKAQKIATDDVKQAAIDAAVEQGNLVKETSKGGKTIYKTAARYGKQIEVTLDTFEKSLETGWLDKGVAKNVWAFDTLARSAYESAQKCMTFTDVINAWKDAISTGWMNTWTHVFGQLSESMELFSNICNKVGESLSVIAEFRNDIFSQWADRGGRNSLWSMIVGEVVEDGEVIAYEGAYGFLDVLNDIGDMISKGFINMLGIFARGDHRILMEEDPSKWATAWLSIKIDDLVKNVRSFLEAMKAFFNETAKGSDKSRWEQIQDVVNAIYSTFALAYITARDLVGFVIDMFDENHLGPSIDSILRIFSALGIGITDAAIAANEGSGLKLLLDQLLVTTTPLTAAINGLVESISNILVNFIETGKKEGTFTGVWQTICDIINLLGQIVAKVGPPILNFVKEMLEIVVDLFSGEMTSDKIAALGSRFEKAISQLISDLFGLIPGFGSKIEEFLAYIFGFKEDYAEGAADEGSRTILGVAKKWLHKIFGGVSDLADGIQKDAGKFNLFTWIKTMLGLNNTRTFINDMANIVKGTNLYSLIMAFLGGYSLFKLIGVLSKGKSVFDEIGGFFEGVTKILKEGIQITLSKKVEEFGEKFLNIAKGIALVAAAVAILGSMSPTSLIIGFVALAAIMGALYGFVYLVEKHLAKDLGKLNSTIGIVVGFGAAVLGISIGLTILMLALLPFTKLNFLEQTLPALAALSIVVALLYAFVKKLNEQKVSLKKTGFIGTVVALSVVIAVLVTSLLPYTNLNFWQIVPALATLGAVVGILYLFVKKLNAQKISLKNTGFIGTVIALGVVIAVMLNSLLPFAGMDVYKDIVPMLTALFGVVTILGLFIRFINKESGKMSMKNTGMGQVILLAAAIWVLVKAIEPLANYEWEQLGKMGAGLAVMMLILGIFIDTTDSMKSSGMEQVIFLAAAIWLLVKALEPLAGYEWEHLAKMGVGLVVIVGVLIWMTKQMEEVNLSSGISTFLMLIGLAAVIGLFGLAMSSVKGLNWDQILWTCLGFIAVLVAFGYIQQNMLKETDILEAVHTLILLAGLAAVMLIFSISLNEIKDIPTDKILAFSIGLSILIAAIGLMVKLTEKVSLTSALKTIVVLAVGIAAILGVVSFMAPIVLGSIGSSVRDLSANLALVGSMFADFVSETNKFSESDLESAKRKFEIMYDMVKNMSDVGSYLKAIHNFSECLLTLGSGLHQFQMSTSTIGDPEDTPAFKTLEKLLGYKDQLANFSGSDNAAVQFIVLGAGLNVFNTETSNITNAKPAALELLDNLITYGDMSSKISGAYTLAEQVVYLAVGLNVFNDQVSGITNPEPTGFGLLDKLMTYGDLGSKLAGASLLGTRMFLLGSGLSGFSDSTTDITDSNPIALQLLTNMANNADNLSTLTTLNLTGFSDMMTALGGALSVYALGVKESSGIEPGDIPDVSGAISILQSLTTGLSGENGKLNIPDMPEDEELTHYGTQLAALAGGLIKFADASTGLGEGTDKALEVLTFLKNLKEDLTADNIAVTKVFGDQGINVFSLTSFGLDIIALGTALKSYSNNTSDFVRNQGALDVLSFMSELKQNLSSDDLSITKELSENGVDKTSLDAFGIDISALGANLKKYSDNTAGFVKNQGALDALTFLSSLRFKLNASNILFTKIFDNNDVHENALAAFGNDIAALGGSMATYSNSVSDFKKNQNALDAIDFFYDLQTKLTADNFVASVFTTFGDTTPQTIASFGEQIGALGESLAGFATNVNFRAEGENLKKEDFESALVAVQTLEEIAISLPTTGGLHSIIHGSTQTIGDLATDVEGIGTALSNLSDSLSKVGTNSGKSYDITLVNGALKALDILADIGIKFSTTDKYEWTAFNYVDKLTTMVDLISSETNPYNQKHYPIVDFLIDFMKQLQEASTEMGIAEDSKIFESFKNVVSAIHDASENNFGASFFDIGENMVTGIVEGITKNADKISGAIRDAVLASYDTGKKAIISNSPSKLFATLGQWSAEGIAMGINQNADKASEASANMAEGTFDSASDTLSAFASLISSDFDAQPMITPVLDLTNVTTGAQEITNLLGGSVSQFRLDVEQIAANAAKAVPGGSYDFNYQPDYTTITTRLDNMGKSIANLGTQMANLKIVLNTGVVAGAVTDGVDRGIGRNMLYASRKN